MHKLIVMRESLSDRRRHRALELSELDQLVMLLIENPIVVGCLKIVCGACLSHGIIMENATQDFQAFIDKYYKAFCEDAIRCMFLCGFVAWRLVKGPKEQTYPEVLPLGGFEWEARPLARNRASSYKVNLRAGVSLLDKDIHVYSNTKPMCMPRGILSSPLKGLLRSHGLVTEAENYRSYADMWNSQARLFVSHQDRQNMYKLGESGVVSNGWSSQGCDVFQDFDANDDMYDLE